MLLLTQTNQMKINKEQEIKFDNYASENYNNNHTIICIKIGVISESVNQKFE